MADRLLIRRCGAEWRSPPAEGELQYGNEVLSNLEFVVILRTAKPLILGRTLGREEEDSRKPNRGSRDVRNLLLLSPYSFLSWRWEVEVEHGG